MKRSTANLISVRSKFVTSSSDINKDLGVCIDDIVSPCFVIDARRVQSNVLRLKEFSQKAGIRVLFALKAFAFYDIFPLLREVACGGAVSSLSEAKLANEFLGGKLHAYCPVYLPQDFNEIVSVSSHITFNSICEFNRWGRRAVELNPAISCGLRINPEYSPVEVDLYNPCSPNSRLGVLESELRSSLLPESISSVEGVPLKGLHCHNLCESGAEHVQRTLSVLHEKFGDYLSKVQWLNLGGGHLVTRDGYDLERAVSALYEFKCKYPNLEISIEPGAAFVWETGWLVATVLDIVCARDVRYLMLDISIAAHMPDCLEMPYTPRIYGARICGNASNKNAVRVGGVSCLAGDWVGGYEFDVLPNVGDKLLFEDMSHYTMVKTTTFNGVSQPSMGVIENSSVDGVGVFRLVKSFGYQDYKMRHGV